MLLGANLLFPEKKGGLPYDAEVEYLQGDGVAYIDLGYGVTETDTSYLNIGFFANRSSSTSSGGVYGWWTSALSRQDLYLTSTTINFLQNATKRFNDTVNDTDYLEFQIKAGDNFYKKNEEIAQSSTSTVKAKYWAAFFIRTKSATSNTLYGNASYVRMTYIKGGDGIHEFDLIPVRKGSVGYMYDRVSGKLYGNAGEGAFIVGPDKGLPYDAEVEYLQGDGVAYIDTEVSFSEETFSNIDVELAVDIGVLTHTSTAVQRVAFLGFGTISGIGIARVSGKWRGLIRGTAQGNSVELSLTEAISNVSIKYDDTYGYCYQDGVLLGSIEKSNATTVLPDGMTMCVFGGKYPSNGEVKITVPKDPACRIGSFYVKNKTTGQTFDGIPVRKDGVGYMYDRISGQLFGNAADSGAFIVGPDK